LTTEATQEITVISEHTLTTTVLPAMNYSFLASSDITETIVGNQRVILESNRFNNTIATEGISLTPYITVAMAGEITNTEISLTDISLSAIGTVSLALSPKSIILTEAPQNYATCICS